MTWYPKQIYDGGTLENIANELGDLQGGLWTATVVAGTEATNVVNVVISLLDHDGNAVSGMHNVLAYMSDDSGGDSVASAAADGGVAVGTDGAVIAAITANLVFLLQSETGGTIDLDVTESGADTWYLVVVLPNGSQVVSNAITFT